MGVFVTVVVALAAGRLLGRVRPWRRLGDWVVDEFRFTGPGCSAAGAVRPS
ncbi:hypothetical protein [Streptomyces sp. NPDC012825]|uniref:hypothetical protein n=1 Tax=Streptomyces sp. NPDC012825 TaxID=3364851 RepID=UPI0036741BD1